MARVAEITEEVATEAKTKRTRGRPRTLPEPEELEAPSSDEIDGDKAIDFFELQKMYPPSEWGPQLFMYLFRLGPVIDRDRTGNKHNIQKFVRPVDEDEIMKSTYGGSGDYQLLLNRWNSVTRKTAMIRRHNFKILNMDYPPRIPAGEWINADANREWLWAKPKLEAIAKAEAEAAEKGEVAAAPAGGAFADPGFKWAMQVIEKFLPKGADRDDVIREMREHHRTELEAAQGKPAEMVALITTVASLLRPKEDSGGGNAVIVTMIQGIQTELAQEKAFSRELLGKLLDLQNKPAPTLKDQLADLAALTEVGGKVFGRRVNPAGETHVTEWPEVLARVGEKLLEEAPALMQAFMLGKTGVPPRRNTNGTKPANGAKGELPEAHTQNQEDEEMQIAIRQISTNFAPILDEITPDLVRCFNRGISGMDFRDDFVEEYGRKSYDFMRKMDPQTIVDVLELRKKEAPPTIAAILQQLAPPEKVRQFVNEFLSDLPGSDDDEEEAAPGSQPIQMGPANPGAGGEF